MEERRKILWLCSWYPGMAEPFNGDFVQRHARAAAIYHDIYVIHVYADPNRKINAPITSISTHGGLTEHIIEFPKGKNRLARAISHLRLIRAYKKAVKTFIREHGLPDLVHVHVPVWAGKIALWIKWCYGIPFMVTEHWGIYNDIEVHNFKSKTIWFKKATKRIFLGASAFLSVSRYIAEGVKRLVTPVDYQLFPNAVDTDLFFPVDKSGEVFRFIHVSTMVGLKNVESILRAFESLFLAGKQAELIMVGPATSNIIKYEGKNTVKIYEFFIFNRSGVCLIHLDLQEESINLTNKALRSEEHTSEL